MHVNNVSASSLGQRFFLFPPAGVETQLALHFLLVRIPPLPSVGVSAFDVKILARVCLASMKCAFCQRRLGSFGVPL